MPIVSLSNPSYLVAAGAPAFPQVTLLDSFTDTDAVLLVNHDPEGGGVGAWATITGIGGCEILSNTAVATGVNGANRWTAGGFGPNLDLTWKISAKPADGGLVGFYFRTQQEDALATLDGYYCYATAAAGTDTITVGPVTNGTEGAAFITANQEFASGDSVGVRVSVNDFSLYYKSGAGAWTLVGGPTADTTYTASGNLAFIIVDADATIDDVSARTL